MSDFNRLLRMKAFKPRIVKGVPSRDLGENGDFALATTPTGLILYVKFEGAWWQLTHGKRAVGRGEGREIGAYKNTFHSTVTAYRVKLLSREIPDFPPRGEIMYKNIGINDSQVVNSGFHLGSNDNFTIRGEGSLKFQEDNDGTSDREGVILKRNSGILTVRNVDDSADADIRVANVRDLNNKKSIAINSVGGAVNNLKITNAAGAGTDYVTLEVEGDNTNANIKLKSKGTGYVDLNTGTSGGNVRMSYTDSNYIRYAFSMSEPKFIQYDGLYLLTTSFDDTNHHAQFWTSHATDDMDLRISAKDTLTLGAGDGLIRLYKAGTQTGGFALGTLFGNFDFATSSTCKLLSTTGYDLHFEAQGTGKVIIDSNNTATTTSTSTGLHIDHDATGDTGASQTTSNIGLDIDVNSDAQTCNAAGTVTDVGLDIDVVGGTDGTSVASGIQVNVSGADTNNGIVIDTLGTHIRLNAAADPVTDYATLAVADTGDLTIATAGDGTTDSDLILDADGDIILDAAGGDIKANNSLTVAGGVALSDGTLIITSVSSDQFQIKFDGSNKANFNVAADGALEIESVGTDADMILDAGGDIALDSGTGVFISKVAGTEFSPASCAYSGMILGMTIDGVDEADQSYDLTTSFVVPNSLKFRLNFVTPPSELVEIVCSVSFGASSGGQDLFMSLSNHATYGSNSLSHPDQFENVVWNPPGRGTINQITARWIVASGNLEAIGSANALFIAAKTDNVSGTPKLYWGGDATEEYSPLIIKAVALPLAASITYNP